MDILPNDRVSTEGGQLQSLTSTPIEDLAEEVLYWGCKQIDQDTNRGTSFQSASNTTTAH